MTTKEHLDRLARTLDALAPEVDELRRELLLSEQLLAELRRDRARERAGEEATT